MARQKEYQGTTATTIRGGYVPFMLNRDSHLDVYQNAVNAINEQHEKALEARGKVESSIDQVDLAPEEAPWRQRFKEDVLRQIDNEARYGSYSTSLTKATKLAQTAATSPALLSRAKYYQQYKEWNKELDQRNDISEITKRWAKQLAPNKYQYEDQVDSNGTVIGGNEFTNTRKPLADLDWAAEQGKIGALARASSSASQVSSAVSVDGTGSRSSKGSSSESVTEQQLLDGFNKWYETNYDRVFQDWEVMGFELDELQARADNENLSEIEREKAAQQYKELKTIYDKVHGGDLTEYAAYRLGPGSYASIMKYKRTTSSSDSSRTVDSDPFGIKKYNAARGAGEDSDSTDSTDTTPAESGATQEQSQRVRTPRKKGGQMT